LKHSPDYIRNFSVVVASEIQEVDLLHLSDICRKFGIPLVLVRSYGMFGYCRIDLEEHTIVESHPETVIDLRLDQPWIELLEFANTFDFTSKDAHYLIHIPFPILLLEAMKRWKKSGNSFPPKGEDKGLFHKMIRDLLGSNIDDENTHEAIAHCHRFFQGSKIPTEINQLFEDPLIDNIGPEVNGVNLVESFLDSNQVTQNVCRKRGQRATSTFRKST
jgi:NEDD8-activating enzyme E1 regulatory subunit